MHNIKLDQRTAYSDEQIAAGLLCAFAVNSCIRNNSVLTFTLQLATQTQIHTDTHTLTKQKQRPENSYNVATYCPQKH